MRLAVDRCKDFGLLMPQLGWRNGAHARGKTKQALVNL
jgi:hypothetical protein